MVSAVWEYFNKTNVGKQARCSLCHKALTYCGSPSTLRCHLANVHQISLPKITRSKRGTREREESEDYPPEPNLNNNLPVAQQEQQSRPTPSPVSPDLYLLLQYRPYFSVPNGTI